MKNLEPSNWILEKRINLSNIIMGLTIAVSIIWWAAQIDKRIAVLEAEFKAFYETQSQLLSVLTP
ncbi:MAG: hypothetical protein JSS07_04540 [Proteobacteria bacterium]|nr:hypothetical protein [Pseudomonadota bacterium]